jgi:hypothetical protein
VRSFLISLKMDGGCSSQFASLCFAARAARGL